MRYWWARLRGTADGPRLAKCPVCGDFFDRAAGEKTNHVQVACSVRHAEDWNQIQAF